MKLKISARELKDRFLSSFYQEKNFRYEDNNPFMITFERKKYFVFLKNISPAYYPKYPDITRIQLPYSPHFKIILRSKIPFIILGYNAYYKTFTAWDPNYIKIRLNVRSNVSLFSRDSFQEKIRLNIFKEHHLSNGDKVIVFSYKSLPLYFRNYIILFENSLEEANMKFVRRSNDKLKTAIRSDTKAGQSDHIWPD